LTCNIRNEVTSHATNVVSCGIKQICINEQR
jgi:hypothetical protein